MKREQAVNLSLDISIHLAFFTIIVLWTFLGIFITQSLLIQFSSGFDYWILMVSVLIMTYPIPITGISWYAKQYTISDLPEWTFVERDVSFNEFQNMIGEYHAAYPQLMSIVYPKRVIAVLFLSALSIYLPFLLRSYSLDTVPFSSPTYGFCLIAVGVTLVATILPAVPSSLSEEFPDHSVKEFKSGFHQLVQIPGIYWVGIRLIIGEWAGYYTLRDPHLSARIEGIESVVAMIYMTDSHGTITQLSLINESEHQGFPINESISTPSPDMIRDVIRNVIEWYIEITGERDILQYVLDDLADA